MRSEQPRQPPGPKLSLRERREAQVREHLTELIAAEMQLKRTLWIVVRATARATQTPDTTSESTSPSVIVDQADLSQLWDLSFTEVEGEPTKLRIAANQLPEATEEQLCALFEKLNGTDKDPREFQKEIGLEFHPAGYIQAKLMSAPPEVQHAARQPLRWDGATKKWIIHFGTLPTGTAQPDA